jgi:Zn-finger nucleic acid-binding protein
MNCKDCGAPLPANSNICSYCGCLNDVDLRAMQASIRKGPESDRVCPHCGIKMQTIDLGLGGEFLIERCDKCLGMFFDPNEIEALIDQSVKHVYGIDQQRMEQIIEEEQISRPAAIKYIRCPVCGEMMNRRNYGARSGVVVDECRQHGIWLDGGELSQIMKWVKAGGRLHDEKRQLEQLKEKQRNLRRDKMTSQAGLDDFGFQHGPHGTRSETDLFVSVVRLVSSLFR